MFCLDEDCVFGCFKGDRLWYSIYLGVAAGIGGHAGLNFLLKFLSTQIIGTALLAEPVVGSIIGYALDVQGVPGLWTWLGGGVLMVGLWLTIKGGGCGEGGEGGGDRPKDGGKGTWVERKQFFGENENDNSNNL